LIGDCCRKQTHILGDTECPFYLGALQFPLNSSDESGGDPCIFTFPRRRHPFKKKPESAVESGRTPVEGLLFALNSGSIECQTTAKAGVR
jgi:hypothetical protein